MHTQSQSKFKFAKATSRRGQSLCRQLHCWQLGKAAAAVTLHRRCSDSEPSLQWFCTVTGVTLHCHCSTLAGLGGLWYSTCTQTHSFQLLLKICSCENHFDHWATPRVQGLQLRAKAVNKSSSGHCKAPWCFASNYQQAKGDALCFS